MTYKTRAAIVDAVGFNREFDIRFRLTEIPVGYPVISFVDFQPAVMLALFDFAAGCAARHGVWLTRQGSIHRNTHPQVLAPEERLIVLIPVTLRRRQGVVPINHPCDDACAVPAAAWRQGVKAAAHRIRLG